MKWKCDKCDMHCRVICGYEKPPVNCLFAVYYLDESEWQPDEIDISV